MAFEGVGKKQEWWNYIIVSRYKNIIKTVSIKEKLYWIIHITSFQSNVLNIEFSLRKFGALSHF